MRIKNKKKSTSVDRPADTNKVSDAKSLEPKVIRPSECVTARNNNQAFIRETVSDGYDADIESELVSSAKISHRKGNKKRKRESDIIYSSEDRSLNSECLTEIKNNIACEQESSECHLNAKYSLFGFFNKIYTSVFIQENSMTVLVKKRIFGR